MKIVQYRAAGETKCGLETDDGIYATGYADTLALIRDGDRGLERAASAAERGDPVSVERILAPITNPGKNFDTFCPTGPRIVTKDELPDWEAIRIQSHVNGELRQDALVGEQLGPPPVAIEWLSSIITLEPGDCLMTGTPAGCGTFMQPPRFLQPGDTVTVSASGVGELTNPVVQGTGRTR